ncbi:C-C chemokine receptor type 8-like [Poeciliopsis prolifica]|uniref:C-C chemokine receptor type 8-like n=1 Tax=Poeciliopsis prolifica TaxID=188132 RepID=UPI0024132967|nr:C-C chemokine receptor type 8-like [Poeciliopsis prolifica]
MDSSLNFNYDCGNNVCEKSEVKFGADFSVLFSIVISLSLIGNILVLVILALYENLKSLTNIFILNLAISDLVFTSGLPFWVISHVWGLVFPDIVYKFLTFVLFIGFYSNIFFLTIMSGVYRYLTDVHLFRKSHLGFLSLSVWMISIAPARLHTYPIGTQNMNLELAFHVSQQLAFSSCCWKPVVYAIINEKFRSNLMSLLLKICRRKNPVNEEEVRVQNPSQPP